MEDSFFILDSDDDPAVQLVNDSAMATERGERYRSKGKSNQDRVATGQRSIDGQMIRVDMVCDGLGGYGDRDGELAAQALCESLQQVFEELDALPECIAGGLVQPMLSQASDRFESLGMDSESGGTTFVLAVTLEEAIHVFHLGDSPALFFHPDGTFISRTTDHKPLGFEDRFKLTHYVHKNDPAFPVEVPDEMIIKKSDHADGLIMILCSDGISDNLMTSVDERVCHPKMSELVKEHGNDPESMCSSLMKLSRERMEMYGMPEGEKLDVKPDNSACLVKCIHVPGKK